ESRLQQLLAAYNTVARTIDGQSAVQTASDGTVTPGAFTGDITPRQIRQQLSAVIATSFGNGPAPSPATIGITTAADGTLTLDHAKFQAALGANPEAVRALVAGTATQDGIAGRLVDAVTATTRAVTGSIAVRTDGLSANIRGLRSQIDAA